MIVALADDLTGAAEMGGIAWRHGLIAEVQTKFDPDSDADLIVVDTDSRSLSGNKAYSKIAEIVQQCQHFTLFKKVDSVLRGNVLVELAALLETLGSHRALLVAANPRLGRIVENDQYLIDGQPLHQTDFANDPEHPATTSNVKEILRQFDRQGIADQWPIEVHAAGETMPERGIVVGEAAGTSELQSWANRLDRTTIPAGAAEFFSAFLSAGGYPPQAENSTPFTTDGATLFVCGSTSASARFFCQNSESVGVPVLRMPLELLVSTTPASELIQDWVTSAIQALEHHSRVVVAIDRPVRQADGLSQALTTYLSTVVERILNRSSIDHLLVEGGATAAALIQRLNWQQMRVKYEFAPGVVCMQVVGQQRPFLTMKPGSYIWPDDV